MNNKAIENRRAINHIKNALALGWVTYDEAKEMAKPVIESINKTGVEIAKKYNKKYHPITFIELMR